MQDNGGDEATPRVLAAATHVLERLVARNDRISPEPQPEEGKWRRGLEGFCGARAPSISIGKYVERIHRYTGCSPACFVVGFVYIDRAVHRRPSSLVVSLNVHRLIVTSVLIASKVLDDTHQNNAFYARVGGVSNSELNRLELDLLFLLDFDVMVSLRVFESYCLHLEKEMMMWGGDAGQKIKRAILDAVDEELEQAADGNPEESWNMVFFFMELGLLRYSMIMYCPSMVAASAVFAARCTLKKNPHRVL